MFRNGEILICIDPIKDLDLHRDYIVVKVRKDYVSINDLTNILYSHNLFVSLKDFRLQKIKNICSILETR